ncbi:MAG: hypothetical protein B7Z35_15680, partial [Hydrogenophilales bacterium 12-61-10]
MGLGIEHVTHLLQPVTLAAEDRSIHSGVKFHVLAIPDKVGKIGPKQFQQLLENRILVFMLLNQRSWNRNIGWTGLI